MEVLEEIMVRTHTRSKLAQLLVAAFIFTTLGITACGDAPDQPVSPSSTEDAVTQINVLSKDNPGVARAMDVQNRNTERFMAKHGVVGTGTGLDEEGNPAVIIFTERELGKGIPTSIDGIPVIEQVVGVVEPVAGGGKTKSTASKTKSTAAKPKSSSASSLATTARHPRPAPIGISTSNYYDCGAGTIGVRVRGGDNVYALSCNHVWGRLNAAQPGESILQPGSGDVACAQNTTDIIGQIAGLEPIVHLSTASNVMDATMMLTSTAELGNGTPTDGYGIPSSTPVDPVVGMSVQKYGRTTGLTKGKISAINVTIGINYGYGTARFVDQIAIAPARKNSSFVEGGDSGSLVVTDNSTASPIGMIFAKSGSIAYANPIKPILTRFNVTIDGK
ncbi:MAG: hypothetical protein RBU27_07330 [Bacteroidota bacterium]|jgi:hypothetical protein|nr:hypothetical protein [Bacteroidota bacterium]